MSRAAATVARVAPDSTADLVTTPAAEAVPDSDSRAWLDGLRAAGAERDAAVQRLHALLLRGARFEVA
jgi:RNA polymerase sigma-70 factor, ECF subfamily